MKSKIIEKTIAINASPEKVWSVFRDPKVTKEMGGHYASDWKIDGSFGWKGNDGQMYTHGKLLQITENKLLQHTISDENNRSKVASIITYKINEKNGKTFLHGKEEPQTELDEEDYADAVAGWDEALQAVKEIAENA